MTPSILKSVLIVGSLIFATSCATRAPSQPSSSNLRLSSFALSVPKLEPAIEWYRDSLGLAVGRQLDFPDMGLRMVWLHSDEVQVELVETKGSRSRQSLLREATNPALIHGFGKVGFRVEDVDGWAARLRARGVTFQVDLRDDPPTQSRTFIVLDNSGNWLQFSKPLTASPDR